MISVRAATSPWSPSERLAEGLEVDVVTPPPPASAAPGAGKNRRISRSLWIGLALSLGTASCAEGSANFHARYDPGFTPAPTTVSVFGVLHEGRMSHEAWEKIGPRLSATLGQRACEAGYGDRLSASLPDLHAAVEESVRAEGVTEELLQRLSTSAEGEMILVLTLNTHTIISRGVEAGLAPNGTMPGSGGRTPVARGPSGPTGRGAELSEIGISATLFSVRLHRSVARLGMAYGGSNLAEAIGKFVSRVGALVPGSRCVGWRWGGVEAR